MKPNEGLRGLKIKRNQFLCPSIKFVSKYPKVRRVYPQGPLAGDQLWSVRGGRRRRGDGRLPVVLVLVLLLCQGFNPIHPGRVEQAYSKCKMQKMQTAKCGGRLLLVVVVLPLWQGLNPIHPGRENQPYLQTSICQTPIIHGSKSLYFLATVLSKFQVVVLEQQWPWPMHQHLAAMS